MKLGPILALFALLLVAASGMSFLGYRYLLLASEYREKNLIHLSTVHDALDVATRRRVPGPVDVLAIIDQTEHAGNQARWCLNTLSAFDRFAFRQMGAGRALEICAQDIVNSERAVNQAMQLLLPEPKHAILTQSAIATTKDLVSTLQTMRRDSLHFQPYVDVVEAKIARIVQFGTGIFSVALALVFAFLSRQLLRVWRLQAEKTQELDLITQRFTRAIAVAREGFAIVDKDNRIVACNPQFSNLLAGSPDFVKLGETLYDLGLRVAKNGRYPLGHLTPEEFIGAHVDQMEASGFQFDRQMEMAGDRHMIARGRPTAHGDKVLTRIEVTDLVRSEREQRQIAEALQEAKDRVEAQSLTDPLTGLHNRRHLDAELQRRLENGPVTVIRVDLDRFKQVNDILGHAAGDHVLCCVAKILQDHCTDGDLAVRVGGDEFVFICADGTTEQAAEGTAHSLLAKVLEPVEFDNKRCHYGASFGIATGAKGSAPSELLSNADAALYKAKESGRGTVEVFSNEMRLSTIRDRILADRFALALENGEIIPFYQTQHRADGWDLAGVEVLARWNHPVEGILSPAVFLPIAQQLGMEAELDRVIFESAVKQTEDLRARGLIVPRVAFNVSAPRILGPNFLETVTKAIPTRRENYVFEILESISCEENGDALLFVIDALRDLGFQIDVDDFGSGHASINGVLKIQPHALKIDRNIVMPLGGSPNAERMVSSILDMARSLDVKVVAEGVDARRKADLLRDMGCDILQGFYFSRPMGFEDLETFISSGFAEFVAAETRALPDSGANSVA